MNAEADRVVSEDGAFNLDGNTSIQFQGRTLTAENARYDPETGEIRVDGAMSFRGEGIKLDSNDARIDIDDNLFETGQSEYEMNIGGKRATGTASGMSRTADGKFTLDGATYSTCPPGDKSWYVRADSLNLYPDEGIGTAHDLRLVFKGVPLLALPFFSFPISEMRKTGLLAPIMARGDNTGLELLLPWYWNIRPNLDATFTPRLMSRRGVQLQSEIRYLNEQGAWQLDNEYLRDTAKDGRSRGFVQLRHSGTLGIDWTSSILASRVTDDDYFDDLGDSLQLASITHLEQRAELNLDRGPLEAMVRLQAFQTVDENIRAADRPHRKLPQVKVRLDAPERPLGLRASLDGEFVYFDKDDDVTGTRIDLQPRLSLPVERDAWFITPSVSHRFTYYKVNNTDEVIASTRSRNLDTLSVDAGLFFDRERDASGDSQTLEPRAYYLRVPYEDQSSLPVFDSSAFDFNISQLFRENRFSGSDRVADAEQLSLAMTTRFIDGADGHESLRASIGQIFYFDDRRVSLPVKDPDGGATGGSSDAIETRDTSDFVAEAIAEVRDGWFTRGSIQWNPNDRRTVRSSLLLSYRPDEQRIVNVAHRRVGSDDRRSLTEQIDLSVLWPIASSWRLAGRWNYSLDADRSIESLLGLEYDSCCWSARFAARRFIADNGDEHDTSLYFQLVLKGLAPVGQNYGALLESSILGYHDTY